MSIVDAKAMEAAAVAVVVGDGGLHHLSHSSSSSNYHLILREETARCRLGEKGACMGLVSDLLSSLRGNRDLGPQFRFFVIIIIIIRGGILHFEIFGSASQRT